MMEFSWTFSSRSLLVSCSLISLVALTTSVPNICLSLKTCGACIGQSVNCHWCNQREFEDERCDTLDNLMQKKNCSLDNIVIQESNITASKNETPRNAIDNEGQDPIQLAPQSINISLRPNKPFTFSAIFRQAENYPVDLYFIMDASYTMISYKDNLANLSQVLVDQISSITTNYRLGFGSFVDKTVMPYVRTTPEHLAEPCSDCVPPYGFRNQLSLTNNVTEFKDLVGKLNISGNLDAPEGGFDAIMQAVACKEEIGWRSHSRKIILFSTDGSFHYAGDGKLGGIVVPNDGQCHIDNQGYYSESKIQDYPSISQLSNKILEKKMNVIFAVPKGQFNLYSRLSSFIVGSNVGQLTQDNSNVAVLVKENYDRIRSSIQLKTEGHGDLEVSFRVKCPSDNVMRDSATCGDIGIGQEVRFEVSVLSKSCPTDSSQSTKSFQIYPVGLTDKLIVNVDLICECSCELPGQEEKNSTTCNLAGSYKCGFCECNSGSYGRKCECSGDGGKYDDLLCRMTNTSEVCQDKGRCECGQCICKPIILKEPEKRYSGKFCQCNNYNCDYYKLEICGGPSRGYCDCGQCRCKEAYNGTRCECPTDQRNCTATNGQICNGKGECKCGVCYCNIDPSFKGPTCEDCPTCPGKCEDNRPCIQCNFKPKEDPCYSNCSTVEKANDLHDFASDNDWRKCKFRDDDSCDIHFVYNYKTNHLKAQRTKECPYQVSNQVIIISVICGIIAIGIICLLIWKIIVTVHDRREYEAFLNEQKNVKWNTEGNPLYKEATSKFQNPTFVSKRD